MLKINKQGETKMKSDNNYAKEMYEERLATDCWNDFFNCPEVHWLMNQTLNMKNQDGSTIKAFQILDEANYRLECYNEEGHDLHDLKYEDNKRYHQERNQLKYYVNKWSKKLNHIPNSEGYCNEYDTNYVGRGQ